MKNKIKNKSGSTMILLVMAVAIISLLGTSVLGVTMMNLKIKKANTDIKKSFYMSESGLDKAYDKMYGFVLEAVKNGNDEVQLFSNDLNDEFERLSNLLAEDNIISEHDVNIEFKGCIEIEENDEVFSLRFNQEKIDNKQREKFSKTFKEYFSYNSYAKIDSIVGNYEEDGLEVSIEKGEQFGWNRDSLKIPITSLYKLKDEGTDKEIIRNTHVDLIVKVPVLSSSYTYKTEEVNINPFWTKSLAANYIEVSGNETEINIEDDVFVSENLEIYGEVNPRFNGGLAVRGDINLGLKEGNEGNLTGKDIYAKNIHSNGINSSLIISDDAFIKDDLEINNAKQVVKISGDYYGFEYGEEGPDTSSSIIINNTDTDISVDGDTYLNGSAYINATNSDGLKYQTGESISVKGNYKGYALDLEGWKVDFGYYGDLYLADAHLNDDNERGELLNISERAKYIAQYAKEMKDTNIPRKVYFGNIFSKGAALNNEGKVYNPPADDLVLESKVAESRKKYENEINRLGFEKANLVESEDELGLLFDVQVPIKNVTSRINEPALNGEAWVYINPSEDDVYNLDSKINKGLIITKGKVIISGDVNFKGAIVANEIIIIGDGKSKKFSNERKLVARILSEKNLKDTLFKANTISDKITFPVLEGSSRTDDFSRFIVFENWKLNSN